jgi:hypothetical protein
MLNADIRPYRFVVLVLPYFAKALPGREFRLRCFVGCNHGWDYVQPIFVGT